MKRKTDIIITIFQLILVVMLVMLSLLSFHLLSELSAAGTAIRYIGEVCVDTQGVGKRELNNDPEDRQEIEVLRAGISTRLKDLSSENPEKNIRLLDDQNYKEELSRLYMQWRKFETLIDLCRNLKGNDTSLFMLSIEHHDQAKITLESAEKYLNRIVKRMQNNIICGILLLVLLTSTFLLQFYINTQIKKHFRISDK